MSGIEAGYESNDSRSGHRFDSPETLRAQFIFNTEANSSARDEIRHVIILTYLVTCTRGLQRAMAGHGALVRRRGPGLQGPIKGQRTLPLEYALTTFGRHLV